MSSENQSIKDKLPMPGEEVPNPKPPRALLAAVIIMGVLLVAGFVVVIVTVISRVSQSDGNNTGQRAAAPRFALETLIPAGAEVRSMALNGSNLVVHVAPKAGGSGEIIIYDIKKGREHARFVLKER